MSEAHNTTTPGRPWHLWLIGILQGLWCSMGAMSFLFTQMRNEAVMSRFPPEQRAYFESFPLWAVAFWALGVFGGEIGCLLLLFRQRFAVPVLFASLIGAIVSNLGPLFFLGGLKVMGMDGLAFTAIPIGIAVFVAFYARAMRTKGVLT